MSQLRDSKRDNPTVLTWLKYLGLLMVKRRTVT